VSAKKGLRFKGKGKRTGSSVVKVNSRGTLEGLRYENPEGLDFRKQNKDVGMGAALIRLLRRSLYGNCAKFLQASSLKQEAHTLWGWAAHIGHNLFRIGGCRLWKPWSLWL
jgi:hypothetical protein